jgi:xylulokinase
MVSGRWWAEALDVARVPSAVLPSLTEVGEPVAPLRADLARSWGIDRIPVVAGANDQTAAALGAGLTRPGETALGLGTAMVTYRVAGATEPAPACRPLRGPYPGGLRYQLLVCSLGGACLEWARGLSAPGRSWDRFFADALAAEPGGLRFRPDSGVSGESAALSGIVPGHTGAQVARAVLDGVAAAARDQLDALGARGTVRLTGGGARNDGWVQLLADTTGRALERVEQPHAGLWGTAVAAGHGAGIFPDMLRAARAGRAHGRAFRPSGARRRRRA